MSAIAPGSWVAHANPIPQNCPCMLVVRVKPDGRYLCRFVWEDSDRVAPVTVEASEALFTSDRYGFNAHRYFASFHAHELEAIDGRRDVWPEGRFENWYSKARRQEG